MKTIKFLSIATLLAVLVVVGLMITKTTPMLGTQVQNDLFYLTGGIKVGSTGQFAVDTSGNVTTSGTLSAAGSQTLINDFVETGTVTAISTSSATYTLTAAQLCPSTLINFTPLAAATTVTFPATSTAFFASCLPSVGSVDYLNWISTGTSTVIAAGAGGTLGYSSSTTVAAGKYAQLRLIRDTALTYKLLMINVPN